MTLMPLSARFASAFDTMMPWLGPALLLFASLIHGGPERATIIESLLDIRAEWLFVHVIQAFVFGLLGLWLVREVRGDSTWLAHLVRLCAFVFATLYIAADGAGGVGTSIVLDIYTKAPDLDFVAVEGLLYALMESNITRAIFFIASSAWLIAALSLALRCYAAGKWIRAIPLIVAGAALFIGHGTTYGAITAISLLVFAYISTRP